MCGVTGPSQLGSVRVIAFAAWIPVLAARTLARLAGPSTGDDKLNIFCRGLTDGKGYLIPEAPVLNYLNILYPILIHTCRLPFITIFLKGKIA